jgi:hypothetical protein
MSNELIITNLCGVDRKYLSIMKVTFEIDGKIDLIGWITTFTKKDMDIMIPRWYLLLSI